MKKASDLRIPFAWEERRSVLLDRCIYIPGCYEKHAEWLKIPWSDPQMFGNDHPVAVEYCSGNGQWICSRAKQYPQINWVAVEKRFDRARKIWARLHRENLQNLFVVCGEALVFSRYYCPKKSVSEIFVNFPDPWPKRRHAKHRIVRPEFLQEVEPILTSSGKALFVTDDETYAKGMIEVLQKAKWRPLFPAPHFVNEWPDFGDSFFSDLWREKGRAIRYLLYEAGS